MNRRGRHARWPLLIGLLFLLALIPFALFRGSQVPEAEAAWWNESWQYRQSIAVTNNTTQQTNVYISVSLDTSHTSKFQADCGDLRFTKQNGQLLPYYIVSGCGTASTSVHVQLDTFPAGAQTLYAYYGNPSADNGFSSNDFLTQATNYTVGGIGSEETGPGPVAYWKFDEGSGQTINDSGGSGIGGVLGRTSSLEASYDPQWRSADNCISGSCLYFDGIDDKVAIAKSSTVEPDFITISAWIRTSNTTSNQKFFSHDQGNPYQSLLVTSDGRVRVEIDGVSAGMTTKYGSRIVNDGKWHYVAATYDGSLVRLYVDGQVDLSASYNGGVLQYGSAPWAFGVWGNTGEDFTGFIDEPKIFPYALTEDQIKAEYNLGAAAVMGTGPYVTLPASGTLSDSLVAHWAFDEQYGQAAHDKVGNNHGTFGANTSPGSDDPTWAAAGECKVNGCLGFDEGDYANVGDLSSFDFSDSNSKFTVTAWLKPTTIDSTQKIVVGKHNPTGNMRGWAMGVEANNKMTLWLSEDGTYSSSTTVRYQSASTVVANELHHWAFVIDIGSDTFNIYRDGVLESGTHLNSKTTVTDIHNGTAPVMVGALSSLASYFTGNIDELKIYNTALTADQIKQDMNAGASVAYSVGSEEADELADGAGAPPIAEWKFDEKQGTLAYDSSGSANDGTVNGATWRSGCKQGACLEFDGVDDYVQIPNSASLYTPNNNQWTMQAWVYSTDTSGIRNILRKNPSGGAYFIRMVNGAFQSLFNFTDGYSQKEGGTIQPNQWQHVAATYDGTTQRHYVNGQIIAQWIENRTLNFETSTYVAVGRNSTSPTEYWQGQIDHVRVYDYARTPAQIAYDYNRGAPAAHWKFDECEGTVAHDASGNENHGTINIGATGTQTTAGTCSTSGAWANGASGKFEGSLNFDGTDDYVSVADSNSISVTNGPFSYFAWVYVKGSLASNTSVLRKRPSNFVMGYNSRLIHCNLNGTSVNTGTQLLSNSWHFLGCTYDGTTLKGYLDGVLQGSVAATPVVDSNQVLELGGQSTGSQMVNGQIDDVRIYNYALSPSQIQKVHNQGYGVRYAPSD